ncbi:MAG: hypothetical protein RQ729_12990 [Wenzhouxiangellaceae bacterium]|nr:hypothetical protein [Wenzhouxiangellaceae bacterium]
MNSKNQKPGADEQDYIVFGAPAIGEEQIAASAEIEIMRLMNWLI